jgi:hypothetical protein
MYPFYGIQWTRSGAPGSSAGAALLIAGFVAMLQVRSPPHSTENGKCGPNRAKADREFSD